MNQMNQTLPGKDWKTFSDLLSVRGSSSWMASSSITQLQELTQRIAADLNSINRPGLALSAIQQNEQHWRLQQELQLQQQIDALSALEASLGRGQQQRKHMLTTGIVPLIKPIRPLTSALVPAFKFCPIISENSLGNLEIPRVTNRAIVGRHAIDANIADLTSSSTVTALEADEREEEGAESNSAFPFKIHRMITQAEKEGKDDIISFLPDGKAFTIHKSQEFVDEIMPLYFSSSRLSSFQRQLNLYGYKRIGEGPYRGAFRHKFFIKDQPLLCKNIQRKKTATKKFSPANAVKSSKHESSTLCAPATAL